MLLKLYQWLPPDGVKIVLVLFLAFLIGIEREEHKKRIEHYAFGGVRTFPLIGLIGYALGVIGQGNPLPVTLGFVVVASFLLLSYWRKLTSSETAGVTTEMSGLATYMVGALVFYDHLWIATTLAIASALLLELKAALDGLTKRISSGEILTFTKFLLLSVVILPALPDKAFGPFQINPFKTWLVVVAVSAISYGSYVLQRLTRGHGGVILSAILGGAYSSTLTTVVLSKRAAQGEHRHLFAGGILMASGIMYLRLVVLVGLFNHELMVALAPPFLLLAAVGCTTGWLWSRRRDTGTGEVRREFEPKNPLELGAAFLFAVLFLAMLAATRLAIAYLGHTGAYGLAVVTGVTDVDPFILSMTQAAGTLTPLKVASASILIAAASNNLVKGVYARCFADRKTGSESFWLLAGLGILGLAPLFWQH
ncbi:MAG TPA: MgtC/SapB family protein [Candidatus Angelobacter sp.]|nr:MgtC/SapB family protein [Candidatus Angelobacter sp.]